MMANRTKRGTVTAAARKAHGSSKKSPNKTGSFPIFDHQSAMSAVKLRGHAKSKKNVLDRASRYASSHHDATVKNAVAKARNKDKRR